MIRFQSWFQGYESQSKVILRNVKTTKFYFSRGAILVVHNGKENDMSHWELLMAFIVKLLIDTINQRTW